MRLGLVPSRLHLLKLLWLLRKPISLFWFSLHLPFTFLSTNAVTRCNGFFVDALVHSFAEKLKPLLGFRVVSNSGVASGARRNGSAGYFNE
jgi:hypothetical protein